MGCAAALRFGVYGLRFEWPQGGGCTLDGDGHADAPSALNGANEEGARRLVCAAAAASASENMCTVPRTWLRVFGGLGLRI